MLSLRQILVAVDNHDLSFEAARAGADLAIQVDAQLGLVHVIPFGQVEGNPDTGIMPEVETSLARTRSQALFKQIEQGLPGLKPAHFIAIGHAPEHISRVVDDWPADLLVIGAHRNHRFAQKIMGTFAEHIMHAVHCPILLISGE
ncbi:universal stress protein [Pontibacter sp. G13]|uniref:universal stress protein n=1 Tax=Pontibacter sp. G13 TaxID=3074898 RepID=UPI00288A3A40|nr:universal stress protein [Pontibacter sp. G13]WNJ17996.1 universal stress protein [Pontibacter sp. G13]